ncbi:hypothetical protein QVD17_41736 [Tagetes erecta]|uniref:Uncharacterized protein n=1 Tax=Tagetes erecta TaxID=13708 RepID=A0AAD8JN79_TARER|nr:hypothetical protein QVD17_41736 [Tagetes erecta]
MTRSSTGGGRGRGRGNGHDSYNTCRIGRGNGHDSYNIGIIGRGNGHDNFNTGIIGRGNGCDSSNTCTIGRGNGHENYNTNTIGRSHSDAYESLSQSASSDDDDLTVGRRGPVAPTPLPEPRNCEWIWITHNHNADIVASLSFIDLAVNKMLPALLEKFCTLCGPIRGQVGRRFLKKMAIGCLSGYYQWESQWDETVRSCWEKFIKRKFKDSLNRARENAKVNAKVKEKYGNDTSKRPLFDFDTWVGGKKNGRFNIRDPHVMKMGTSPMLGASNSCSTTTNEEVQQMKEKIVQLQEEKETERLEKEMERAEKLEMMEQVEENRVTNAQMKQQIEFLLKNIPKNSYAS